MWEITRIIKSDKEKNVFLVASFVYFWDAELFLKHVDQKDAVYTMKLTDTI